MDPAEIVQKIKAAQPVDFRGVINFLHETKDPRNRRNGVDWIYLHKHCSAALAQAKTCAWCCRWVYNRPNPSSKPGKIAVGDLVAVNEQLLASPALQAGHGLVLGRLPSNDPSYFAWEVLFESGVYPYHQDYLEVMHENW